MALDKEGWILDKRYDDDARRTRNDRDVDDERGATKMTTLESVTVALCNPVLRYRSAGMATTLSAMSVSLFVTRTAGFRLAPPPLALHFIRIRTRACHVPGRNGQPVTAVRAAAGDCSPDESAHVGHVQEEATKSTTPVWKLWQMNPAELKEKVAKLGRAGLLAYGLFNSIIYTSMFYVAFLAFEKSTGQNPAYNLKACLAGMITMWTGNNFTRPLRVAGAAALAPLMDKVLKKTQKIFKLKDEATSLLFLVMIMIVLCILAVGLLILSRIGR